MKTVLRLAIVEPSSSSRDKLKAMLLGMDRVWLEAECSRYEFFSDVVAQTQPDVGIVAIDENPDKALELVARLRETSPDCSILVLSSSADGGLILKAIRAGAKEFLSQPVPVEDMVEALDRLGGTETGGSSQCVTTAVIGAAGGVGTTSIAVNLGCALAEDKEKTVVLVDLDLCLGDADVFLDRIPDHTLVDVAQNAARLDFTLLKRSLLKHSSDLFLLARPVQLDDVELITPGDLQRIFGLLKASFTHLVLDCSKSFGPMDRLAMAAADHVLMVTQLDLPCLRNAVRLMMSFAENEELTAKMKIVVNRVGLGSGQINLKKARDTMGRDIFWQFPNDFRTMVEGRNNGIPLVEHAPKAAITQSIRQLAGALSGDEDAVPAGAGKPSSGGWLKRLRGAKD